MRFLFNNFDISKNKILYYKKIFLLRKFYESKKFFYLVNNKNYLYNLCVFLIEIHKGYTNNFYCSGVRNIIDRYGYFYMFHHFKLFLFDNQKILESYLLENTIIRYLFYMKTKLNRSYIICFYLYKIIITRKKIKLALLLINFFLKKNNTIHSEKILNILIVII